MWHLGIKSERPLAKKQGLCDEMCFPSCQIMVEYARKWKGCDGTKASFWLICRARKGKTIDFVRVCVSKTENFCFFVFCFFFCNSYNVPMFPCLQRFFLRGHTIPPALAWATFLKIQFNLVPLDPRGATLLTAALHCQVNCSTVCYISAAQTHYLPLAVFSLLTRVHAVSTKSPRAHGAESLVCVPPSRIKPKGRD